jgi:hypothetical protein
MKDIVYSAQYKKPATLKDAYSNPRYQGKIVIESPEGLFSTTQESKALEKMKRLHKKYPDAKPVTTIIPRGLLMTTPVKLS